MHEHVGLTKRTGFRPRYTFDVAHDVELADANIRAFASSKPRGDVDIVRQARLKKIAGPSLTTPTASWRDLSCYLGKWKNFKILLGTTLSWFFLVSHAHCHRAHQHMHTSVGPFSR